MFAHDWHGSSLKALVIGKGLSLAMTFVSGLAAFLGIEVSTQSITYGVIATAIATTIVGIASSYPRWVKARGEDWAAIVRELREQNAGIIREMREQNIARLAALERQIVFQNRERVLMRSSKHKLGGFVQNAQQAIMLLEHACKSNGVEFTPYNFVNVNEAFQEEDEQMKELTKIQLSSINLNADGDVSSDF